MQERYSNENNDDYRDIYYMYVKESIKDYNEWLSVEMLESDSDKLLMDKANDLKYYNSLVKHIEKYFKSKKNHDLIMNYLINKESENHKHIEKHYRTNSFGKYEIKEMLDIIVGWNELFIKRDVNYFEDFEDLEDFENFVESLYEEETNSDNEVILESNEYLLTHLY
tara:strand:- start:107 stop:607 length:501 start_codon:yes stop_codon:yes gene_type:complete